MVDLYQVSNGKVDAVKEYPFTSEIEDMKKFVKDNERLLGDIKIFADEATPPSKTIRSDLLAVDKDGNIVILELKNTKVSTEAISQVLEYRTYWLKAIDTVKNFWSKYANERKDDALSEPEWTSFNPKIRIVASAIDEDLLEVAATNHLDIDFIEIRRYKKGQDVFVTVDTKDPGDFDFKPTPGRKNENYDWTYYEKQFGAKWVDLARYYLNSLEQLMRERSWNLNIRYNKYYIAFKYNSRSPFALERSHVDKLSIVAGSLKESDEEPPSIDGLEWSWDKNWSHWYLELVDKDLDVHKISATLQKAYDKVARV